MYFCEFDGGDGPILSGSREDTNWVISSRNGHLHLAVDSTVEFNADIEDAPVVTTHTLAVDLGPLTRIFIDGYECWSATIDLRGSTVRAHRGTLSHESCPDSTSSKMVAEFVRDRSSRPAPLVQFSAMHLAQSDAHDVGARSQYAIHAKFRVRGPGQYGTIAAGSLMGNEAFSVSLNSMGVTLALAGPRNSAPLEVFAAGRWADGHWHHLVVNFARGAREIFVDGWFCASEPGLAPHFDTFVVGQSLAGERLMGEVGAGGIYHPLTDNQIALLSHREVLEQTAVFDAYPNNIFHRIPALTRMSTGTLIAVADARHNLPNDSPNVTTLVASRSTDSGLTWSTPQTIVGYPSDPRNPISTTDAAGVEDSRGRLHVLFDLYPAGIGLLNSAPGHGHDGLDLIVTDDNGTRYTVPHGWPREPTGVVTADGEPTADVVSPGPELLGVGPYSVIPTGHIAVVTSDDDGLTWSEPRLLTHHVKDGWMRFLGLGPGNGIRLAHPNHAGRLLVPVYFSNDEASQFSAAVVISDDDGETWRRSSSTNDDRVVNGQRIDQRTFSDPAATMSESALVELPDGRILMFSRSQHAFVQRSISSDGGETWSHVIAESAIPEIFCQPSATLSRNGELYFANASKMLPYRGCGVLYRATDLSTIGNGDGELVWESRTINPRHHGYQSIVALDGGVGMLWERETAGVWFTFIPEEIFQ